jgi:hypothetical protein
MGIDIRLPLGILFLLVGSVLVVYGAASDSSLYRQSLGINVTRHNRGVPQITKAILKI